MASSEIYSELSKQAIDTLPRVFEACIKIGRKLSKKWDFFNCCSSYNAGLLEDCSNMQILGMEHAVPLDRIYTQVRLVNRIKSRAYKTIEELEAETRAAIERRSLDTIKKAVLKKLENTARSRRLRDAEAHTENLFEEEFRQLERNLRASFQSVCPQKYVNMPMDQALLALETKYRENQAELKRVKSELKTIADDYDESRRELNVKYKNIPGENREEFEKERRRLLEKERSEPRESYEQNLKKLRIREEFEKERRRLLEKERSKLRESYERNRKKLRIQQMEAQNSLSPLEGPYRALVLEYKEAKGKLKATKQRELAQQRKENLAAPLTETEMKKIYGQLEQEIESEVSERTKKELTEKVLNDFGNLSREDGSVISGWDAVSSEKKTLILGKAGAGKTTFLKHIVLKHLHSLAERSHLPIFVTLREYENSDEIDLFDFIVKQFSIYGFPEAKLFIERLLMSTSHCVLLFDGLDEVSQSHQLDVVSQIVKFSKRYRNNQFVVSCRTANYRGQLEGFTEYEVADFGSEQVAEFVSGWFGKGSSLATSFLDEVKHHAGLEELTTTPLLLALLCIGYKRNKKFPDQKALIYFESLDALLIDWDSSKQLRRKSFVERFDSESKKQLLAKVACDTFCEGQIFFKRHEIIGRFNINSVLLPIPQEQGSNILSEYVENHGLLVERAKNIFSFSHLTFQEFLGALHLTWTNNTKVFERLADAAWSDRRWNEVIKFIGGLLSYTDVFLVCLRNRLKKGLTGNRFHSFLVGETLPEAARTFISSKEKQYDALGLDAWFRWRIFEYHIHRASYGEDVTEILGQVSSSKTHEHIAKAAGLSEHLRHELIHDRPLNRAVSKMLTQLSKSKGKNMNLAEESEDITSYISMAGLIAEIIACRARISPELKFKTLKDIGSPNREPWVYPPAPCKNILGA